MLSLQMTGQKDTRQGECKTCPHPWKLLSLTSETPMNREVQENGEGGEGKLKKLLLLKHGLFLSYQL